MKVTEIVSRKAKLPSESERAKAKDLMDAERKKDSKMIKGIFEFLDAGGGWLDFVYRKFPGDMILKIKLTHGETCELPLGMVKHLNNTFQVIKKLPDNLDTGKHIIEKKSRVRFTPVDVY